VPEQRADLFVQKVRQCRVVFDFGDPFLDVEEKEIKRQALKELSAFATSSALRPDAFTDPATYAEVFSMVRHPPHTHSLPLSLARSLTHSFNARHGHARRWR
jgi:serine/threonine-protein phosphatase 2A regulatory subunit B'